MSRRLRRNPAVLAFGGLLAVLVASALAAPLWAGAVAETTPERNRIADRIVVDGRAVDVVSLDGVPIGPTWEGAYFLGADRNGRDVMVRLLYGGRTSLLIGFGAAAITLLLGTALGLVAGYLGGWTDAVLSRAFDVLWAFPVVLLGIALGVSLSLGGLDLGPVTVEAGSLWIPTLVIGVAYVVYVARPVRGQARALREREFVEAARMLGMGPARIIVRELLPNLAPTLLALVPIVVANAILLEAALSFLGAGVQPPRPSWGTMIADGVDLLVTAPHLAIAPGLMLVLTVLSLHVVAGGVGEALDPRRRP